MNFYKLKQFKENCYSLFLVIISFIYSNIIYLLIQILHLSRHVDNDSEFISIYLHNAEKQEGVTFNPLFCTTMGV